MPHTKTTSCHRTEIHDHVFAGGSTMAALMRTFDWAATPFGPAHAWPQHLRTVVRLCLTSRFPTAILWGPELQLLYNDAYLAILGDRHPAALGHAIRDVWSEAWPILSPILQSVLRTGEGVSFEDLAVPTTSERFFTCSYSPVEDDTGQVYGVFCSGIETTERVKQKAALYESEERYRLLTEALEEGIVVHGMDGAILSCNPSAERILGLSAARFIGRTSLDPPWQCIHEDGTPFSGDTHPAMVTLRTGQPQSHVIMGIRASAGQLQWLSINSRPVVPPGHDTAIAVVVSFVDITARKQQEEALRKSEAKFATAFHMSPYAVALTTLDEGRYVDVNTHFLQTFGFRREEVIGRTSRELGIWLDPAKRVRALATLQTHGVVHDLEFNYRTSQGELRTMLHSVAPIEEQGQHCLLVVGTDITARKQAEEKLRVNEERQAFLLTLSDTVRPLEDPVAIMATVSEMVGRHFAAGRCGYAEVPPPYDQLVVARDWTNGVMQSLQGTWPLASFGEAVIAQYRSSQTVIFEDVFADDRVRGYEAGAVAAGSVRSSISVQLRKGGQWVASFYVQDTAVRHWTHGEIVLMEDIAERTWAAVERARAEAALRASEEKYRTLFTSMDEGFCLIEVLFEDGQAYDYRFVEANPAFAKHTGLFNVIGKTVRTCVPQHEHYWFARYGTVAVTGEAMHFENAAQALGRFYDVYAFRVGAPEQRRVAVLFSDITMRKMAEEELRRLYNELEQRVEERTRALRASEERFRLVAHVTNDLLYDWDVQTNVTWRSNGFKLVFGSEPANAPPRDDFQWWAQRLHPEERESVISQIYAAVHSAAETHRTEYRFQRPDETYAFVTDTMYLLRNEHGEVIRGIGALTDITARKEAEAAQRRLTQQLLSVQETERRHLARELHDEVMQTLTALQLNLDGLEPELSVAHATWHASTALVDDLVDQVRTLSLDLRPTVLDELGLAAALEWYCHRQVPRLGLVAHYTCTPNLVRPQPEIETTCFRVVQEAVTNVAKHAATDTVWIELQHDDDTLSLTVRDQGIGFAVAKAQQRVGYEVGIGLHGMAERLHLIDGTLEIQSAPGQGTVIQVRVPCTSAAADTTKRRMEKVYGTNSRPAR